MHNIYSIGSNNNTSAVRSIQLKYVIDTRKTSFKLRTKNIFYN